jgi:serine/threonine protein kinase
MENQIVNNQGGNGAMANSGQAVWQLSAAKTDYRVFLDERHIPYAKRSPYLLVGQIPDEGWLIHISVVRQQFDQLLGGVLDFFSELGLPYTIPESSDMHNRILDGRCGLASVGKVITVCVADDLYAKAVAEKLVIMTAGFFGPACVTAVPLGGCISVSRGILLENSKFAANRYYSPLYGFEAAAELSTRLKCLNKEWPFINVPLPNKKYLVNRLIGKRYLPVQSLKNDAKGSVLKCISLYPIYKLQWCIVKEGRAYHCFDDAGRDIRDRLEWQYRVHRELEGHLPVPAVYDYFRAGNTGFLAMAFIDGQSLDGLIAEFFSGSSWSSLGKPLKLKLVNYALQVLEIVRALHSKAFIHRDLNPDNFMVTENDCLYLVDLELSYSCDLQQPSPAYALGSPGYMSPQQENMQVPDYTDDVYSLGGLLIKLFTGLSPSKFNCRNPHILYDQLGYFLPDQAVCSIFAACMDPNPAKRPALEVITKTILDFCNAVEQDGAGDAVPDTGFQQHELLLLARAAIRALLSPVFCNPQSIWQVNGTIPGAWPTGPLYVAGISRRLGLLTAEDLEIVKRNICWLSNQGARDAGDDLFGGLTGTPFAIAALYDPGYGPAPEFVGAQMENLLSGKQFVRLGLSGGLAGLGLAILNCLPYLDGEEADRSLNEIADLLLSLQLRDGSWLLSSGEGNGKSIRLPGLFHGIAGITAFLLLYGRRYDNTHVLNAATRSLAYLAGKRRTVQGHPTWTLNPYLDEINPWLEDGFTGIVYLFILAFNILGDKQYKEVATAALFAHPENISTQFTGFANGLAGLGEVYLEAAKVFGDDYWRNRAEKIACFFIHTGFREDGGIHYWHNDDYGEPDAGFFNGQAGIIHFLIRFSKPDLVSFPFFN